MTDHFLSLILNVLTVLLNVTFVRSVFCKKRFGVREVFLICMMPIYGLVTSIVLREYVLIKLIINIGLDILFDSWIFRISFKKSVIANAIFYGIYISAEMIAMFAYQLITPMEEYSDMTNTNGGFMIELICQVLVLLIIILISACKRSSNLSRMDTKGWVAFIIIPFLTLVMILFLLFGTSAEIAEKMFYKFFVLSVVMLFVNLVFFYLLDNIIGRETVIREKQLLIEQAEHVNEMYSTVSEEREKQKARSHDYLNHLNIMLKMAEDGEIDKEISYIREQIGKEIECVDVIDTGNPIVNAVLNIKHQEARNRGIVFPLMADDLTGLNISDSDLVIVLSNILDNAIEAVSDLDDKKIVMKIKRDKGSLCIDESNPYEGKIDHTKNRFTTKEDSVNHGYGMINVKKVVSDNNGECFIESDKGNYHITIIIPN